MSFVDRIKSKQVQKQANDFIKLIKGKSDKEIEQIYLDNKDLETNEIALSHLFFNNPSLIRIMPVDFQKSRLNSNLSMFKYGSSEAKKSLVSDWLKDNKFFINCNSINISDEEYKEYLKIYFQQPDDIAKLHMEDLKNVVETLNKIDSIQTDKVIEASRNIPFLSENDNERPALLLHSPKSRNNMHLPLYHTKTSWHKLLISQTKLSSKFGNRNIPHLIYQI